MDLIRGMFRGMVLLSLMAVAQHGCSVKEMAGKAADTHKAGLSSYGEYSRPSTISAKLQNGKTPTSSIIMYIFSFI